MLIPQNYVCHEEGGVMQSIKPKTQDDLLKRITALCSKIHSRKNEKFFPTYA